MPDPTKAGMPCPTCRVDLVMADRQGVEIDYCPRCRGVWLDRGELDKIIERSGAFEPSSHRRAAREDDRRPYREHGHKYRKRHKRKSLLKELFDF